MEMECRRIGRLASGCEHYSWLRCVQHAFHGPREVVENAVGGRGDTLLRVWSDDSRWEIEKHAVRRSVYKNKEGASLW